MHLRLSFAAILILTASPLWFAVAQESSQTSASMSDRDKSGLRGPVKTVIDETTLSLPGGEQVLTTTKKYSPDGRVLDDRTKNSDGSEWIASYTYHSDGRLLKVVSGNTGSTDNFETTYLYDDARRLVRVKSGDGIEISYKYDENGCKSVTERFNSQPVAPNTAYAGGWEGTELGFRPTSGGKATTLYNGQGVATGAQFYDAEGNLVGHIVRKFDAEGRILAEEQAADAPQQLTLPEEITSKLNPEQLKSVGALIAGAQNRSISYSYDAQGRVIERRMSGGVLGEQVTLTTYNDHGDKASERATTTMSPEVGRQYSLTEAGAFIPSGQPKPAPPPMTSETQYTYQYDQYGNWTEQTIVGRSQPDEAFRPGTVIRRKLTYY